MVHITNLKMITHYQRIRGVAADQKCQGTINVWMKFLQVWCKVREWSLNRQQMKLASHMDQLRALRVHTATPQDSSCWWRTKSNNPHTNSTLQTSQSPTNSTLHMSQSPTNSTLHTSQSHQQYPPDVTIPHQHYPPDVTIPHQQYPPDITLWDWWVSAETQDCIHTKRRLPEVLPAMSGLLEEGCLCKRVVI